MRAGWNVRTAPRAVLLSAEPGAKGWQVRGGGYIGTYAPLGRYDVATAWTWLRVDEVYAQVHGALLRTGLCTRTACLAAAAEDLAALGDGRAPATALPATGTHAGSDALPWFGPVVAAALLALGLVTVLLLSRRQNCSNSSKQRSGPPGSLQSRGV